MRIAVIGASGRTGAEFSRLALAAGHEVLAVVRDPARLTVAATTVATADARSAEQLTEALRGVDAVVTCTGPGPDAAHGIVSDAAAAMIQAMSATGLKRVVMVSAAGPYTDGDNLLMKFVLKPIVQRILRDGFADLKNAETILKASTTDWTVLRPPQLTDAAGKGSYRSRLDLSIPWGIRITRADLALALLDAVTDDSTIHKTISVAN